MPTVTIEFRPNAEFAGYNTVFNENLPQFIYLKPEKYSTPKYPARAIVDKVEGRLMVNLVVNDKGNVEAFIFTQVEGTREMTQEVAKVIYGWVFPKISLKGVHVKYVASIPVSFRFLHADREKKPDLPNQPPPPASTDGRN